MRYGAVLAMLACCSDSPSDDAGQHPEAGDRIYRGRNYVAWIDETGFYGKLNGLWIGDTNVLSWGPGYQGAEHIEFPNRTWEPGNDPNCVNTDWCNQYSLAEAVHIERPPAWAACNAGRPGYNVRHYPILVQDLQGGGLKLVYEGPLVKETGGTDCHSDYMFPDGVRRRVILRVGYELYPDYIVRTMQIITPKPIENSMGLIGGFVIAPHGGSNFIVGWLGRAITVSYNGRDYTVDSGADTGMCLCGEHGGIEIGGSLLSGTLNGTSAEARRFLHVQGM